MPTVPRYDTAPIATRPLQLPDAQPEDYGGGAIARGLGQAGDIFAQMRDEEDRLLEDAADVELAGVADTILQQYTQLTGDAAIKGSGDAFETFGVEADRIVGSLRPAQRERFQNRYARRQMELQRGIAAHADREGAALAESTFKSRINIAANAIGRATAEAIPDELPAIVNREIEDIRAAYQERAGSSRSPWRTAEEAKLEEDKAVSAARRMQLEALYAADRIDEANALLADPTFTAQFVGPDLRLAQEGQKRATEQHKVNKAYTEAMAIADPAERNRFIAGLKTNGLLDGALQRQVRELVSGVERQQRDELAVTRVQLAELYNQFAARNRGVTVEAFFMRRPNGARELDMLGLEMINSLNAQSQKAELGRDDRTTYGRFHDALVSDPEKFAKMPYDVWYSAYGQYLGEHRERAQALYESVRQGSGRMGTAAAAASSGAGAGILSAERIAARTAERFGLKQTATEADTPAGRAASARYEERYAAFLDELQLRTEQRSREEFGGKPLPDSVVREIATQVAATQVRVDMDESVRMGSGPKAEASMLDENDEIVYGLQALESLDAAKRLRAYLPIQHARQVSQNGQSLEQIARTLLRNKGRNDPSDWRVSRVAMAILTNNAVYIEQVLAERD